MQRIYEQAILEHFKKYRQMLFLMGPRQCGKTTIAQHIQKTYKESLYLNYDNVRDRQLFLQGQHFIEDIFPLQVIREQKPLIIFDEIQKYKDFKNYLKGFYDHYKDHFHILVTGSHRLDIYTASGDSLMGRYFLYRIHPLLARECINPHVEASLITKPTLVTLDNLRETKLSPSLKYFYEMLKPPYAFQVVYDMPFVERDLFEHPGLYIAPMSTFLSQLL